MVFDVDETSASGSEGSVHLIDLTKEEQEAPFAVREADRSTHAVPGRIPTRAEMLAWLEEHPVVVGIATGVLCFTVIAGALSTVLASDSRTDTDDSAARSEADGGQGSFSSTGSGGANFTSDASKLSRTGAGKVLDGSGDGETATGPTAKTDSPSVRNSQPTVPPTADPSNLDQRAAIGGRAPATGNGPGQSQGPSPGNTGPGGPNSSPDSAGTPTTAGTTTNGGPATAGNTTTTLNPGPNASGPVPTVTTPRVTTSTPATNPTTVTTAGQTTSTTQSTTSTTAPPTTPTTPAPSSLTIAAPANGSSHSFESSVSFAANLVSGATQYCWTFIQGGVTARESCSSATTYLLPARPSGLDPGLVTVRATASGAFGSVSNTIQISLYRSRVINNPTRNLEIGKGALRVGVIDMVGATQYCFRLTQSGYDSGSLCYTAPGNTFNKHHPIWDSLSPGPLTVTATIYGGGTLLAADMVTIQLLNPGS